MEKLELYKKFKVVPSEAKKPIQAGRLKGFTDINPMWRIKVLTEEFGPCGFGWWYKIINQRIEVGSENQKAAFVDIELYVKKGEVISMPIVGVGGSMFVVNESRGPYTSDECFKMALTDAISNACKSLGIGADVYFEKDRTKYDQKEQKQEKKTDQNPVQFELEQQIEKKLMSCKTQDELKIEYLKLSPELKITFSQLKDELKSKLS